MNAHAIPDDNPKTVFGLKKPPTHFTPPVAEMHLGLAMQNGGEKYGMMNWREKTVSSSVYYDAARRHLAAWWDGERVAPDSGVHHLGHVMACCAILLDAEAQANLNDDRPIPGTFAAKMAELVDAAMDAVAGEAPAAGKATAPSVARLARFKVGDRVVNCGDLGTVTRVGSGVYAVRWDEYPNYGHETRWSESELTPAPSKATNESTTWAPRTEHTGGAG